METGYLFDVNGNNEVSYTSLLEEDYMPIKDEE